jgi:hypothetical protein
MVQERRLTYPSLTAHDQSRASSAEPWSTASQQTTSRDSQTATRDSTRASPGVMDARPGCDRCRMSTHRENSLTERVA